MMPPSAGSPAQILRYGRTQLALTVFLAEADGSPSSDVAAQWRGENLMLSDEQKGKISKAALATFKLSGVNKLVNFSGLDKGSVGRLICEVVLDGEGRTFCRLHSFSNIDEAKPDDQDYFCEICREVYDEIRRKTLVGEGSPPLVVGILLIAAAVGLLGLVGLIS